MTKLNDHNSAVIISGPDGVGKEYISKFLCQTFGLKEINMVTTRPKRSNDSKISLSEIDFDLFHNSGKLIGVHTNDNGYKYAYKRNEFLEKINVPIIIETNPVYQKHAVFIKDLESIGLNLLGYFGIIGEEKYLRYNILNRTPDISNQELIKKLSMGKKIVDEILSLEREHCIKVIPVGFTNRETIVSEFINEIKTILR